MKKLEYPNPVTAERIDQVITQNNLTNVEIAKALNMDRRSIMKVRNCSINPQIRLIRWLCVNFDIDANWLLNITK